MEITDYWGETHPRPSIREMRRKFINNNAETAETPISPRYLNVTTLKRKVVILADHWLTISDDQLMQTFDKNLESQRTFLNFRLDGLL